MDKPLSEKVRKHHGYMSDDEKEEIADEIAQLESALAEMRDLWLDANEQTEKWVDETVDSHNQAVDAEMRLAEKEKESAALREVLIPINRFFRERAKIHDEAQAIVQLLESQGIVEVEDA